MKRFLIVLLFLTFSASAEEVITEEVISMLEILVKMKRVRSLKKEQNLKLWKKL